MKPLLSIITLIISFTAACTAQSDSVINLSNGAAVRKHYPIKSCRIVFRFFNGPQNGTKTIIFDDWGNKEKQEAVTMTDTDAMRNNLAGAPPALREMEIPAVQHNLLITVDGQRYAIDIDHHTGAKSPNLLIGGSMEENMKQMIADLPASMRVEEYPTEIDESYSIKPDEFKIPDNIHFQ
jgi:hypothetical protein